MPSTGRPQGRGWGHQDLRMAGHALLERVHRQGRGLPNAAASPALFQMTIFIAIVLFPPQSGVRCGGGSSSYNLAPRARLAG